MRVLIMLISLLPICAYATGPMYPHEPAEQREFQNIYQEMNAQKQIMQVYPQTLAQINATKPSAAGQLIYCSNCSSTVICVSTGTGTGAYSSLSSKTTHCN
jgi:hypothetical protein